MRSWIILLKDQTPYRCRVKHSIRQPRRFVPPFGSTIDYLRAFLGTAKFMLCNHVKLHHSGWYYGTTHTFWYRIILITSSNVQAVGSLIMIATRSRTTIGVVLLILAVPSWSPSACVDTEDIHVSIGHTVTYTGTTAVSSTCGQRQLMWESLNADLFRVKYTICCSYTVYVAQSRHCFQVLNTLYPNNSKTPKISGVHSRLKRPVERPFEKAFEKSWCMRSPNWHRNWVQFRTMIFGYNYWEKNRLSNQSSLLAAVMACICHHHVSDTIKMIFFKMISI